MVSFVHRALPAAPFHERPAELGFYCLVAQKGKLDLYREKKKILYSKPVFTIITYNGKWNWEK
jgi:hypothetical protein